MPIRWIQGILRILGDYIQNDNTIIVYQQNLSYKRLFSSSCRKKKHNFTGSCNYKCKYWSGCSQLHVHRFASSKHTLMKFNISYPLQGTQKSFEIDDDNKCRIFYDKRLGQEIEADLLGDEFKGYIFKICGGNDKDGFPMKQGVFTAGRVRLLLAEGTSCYRPRRKGERKRKSVRGCIVSPDIRALSLAIVKKGDNEIPGLTDITKPRRLGPKRATGIRKLYGLEKTEDTTALIKKNVIRRTFASKKNPNAPMRQKAPKIQRLVTDARLRRKKVIKKEKQERYRKTQAAISEYQKLYNEWADMKRKAEKAKDKAAAEKKAEKANPQPKTAKPEQPKSKPEQTKPGIKIAVPGTEAKKVAAAAVTKPRAGAAPTTAPKDAKVMPVTTSKATKLPNQTASRVAGAGKK